MVERLAILPANLLLSDPAFEWLKIGVPLVLQHDLMTAHTLIPGVATDESVAAQGGATRILRTSVENRNGGFHLECTVIDASTHKVVKVETADASSASVLLPSLNSLARKLDAAAIDFPTKSSQAWQAFATAEGKSNPQERAQFLNQSISRDPNFGLAWVSLVDMIVPSRQADLQHIIDDAKAHRASFDPYDRAKLDITMNRLANAPAADQINAAETALALAPNDLDVLTTLGNSEILQGDAAAGEKSLRHAASLNPANVGLRFQLARGLMELRKFKEAEAVFNTLSKTPAVYPELATCILLEGEKTRAAAIFDKFVASVQTDEIKPLLRAAWEVMAGDRQQGIDLVLGTNFKTPNIHALALSEASVWQMMGGDYAGAQKTVGVLSISGGQAFTLPNIVGLLADKSSPSAEWQKKVLDAGMPDQVKEPIMAYGFFLRGNYDDAVKAWQKVSDASHGDDMRARVMLAASLDRAGKSGGPKIVLMPFTPELADIYSAISFTELRRLLAKM